MPVPQLTPEERQQALEKAKAARIKRAQVREDLKNGVLSLADVLAMKDDPIVGRMKASTLIETLPGYGKAKAEKIMKELDIAESRRLKVWASVNRKRCLIVLENNSRVGNLFVVSGPSGAGKGTLLSQVIERIPDAWVSFLLLLAVPVLAKSKAFIISF